MDETLLEPKIYLFKEFKIVLISQIIRYYIEKTLGSVPPLPYFSGTSLFFTV